MRGKITIGLIGFGLLAGTVFLLWPLAPEFPAVTLTFNGYSADASKAVFGITNHTRCSIAGGRPGIEYLTSDGWTNYYDEEILMVAHAPGLHSGDGWCDERKLPVGHTPWRAHFYYRLYPESTPSTRLTRFRGRVRWLLGFDTTTTQSVSDKLQVVYTEQRTK